MRPTGSIRYNGREVSQLEPHQLIGEGIALVPEGRGVFPRMSVLENLLMGAYSRTDKAGISADIDHITIAAVAAGAAIGRYAFGRGTADAGHRARTDEPTEAAVS